MSPIHHFLALPLLTTSDLPAYTLEMHPVRHLAIVAEVLSADPREAVRVARVGGFEGVLFDAYSPSLRITELSATGRREFRHVISSEGRRLVGLRLDLDAKGLGPGADVDQALTHIERAIEAAAGLAAPLLCIDVGPLPEPSAPPVPPPPPVTPELAGLILIPKSTPKPAQSTMPVSNPAAQSQVDAALIELGRRADRYSVIIALRSDLSSLAAIERALRASDCPWFGLDLDPVALLRDAWPIEEVFSRLGEHVRHVRVRDAILGANGRTRPAIVGAGSVEWEPLLSSLEGSAYNGWLTIDPTELQDRPSAAKAARNHLQPPLQ